MSEESFVINLEDVKQSLLDMPEDLVRECFPAALEAGSDVIERELRARIPHTGEDDKTTEHLEDDIETTVRIDGLSGSAHVGFGSLGYRAVFLEYGHRMVTHNRKQVGFVPAHPFIRPAAEEAAEPAVDAFEASIKENI